MNHKTEKIGNELDMLAQELFHNVQEWDKGNLKDGINNVLAIAQEIKKLEDELVDELVLVIKRGEREMAQVHAGVIKQ